MDYIRLGATGLRVSRLALGCMSYGDPTTLRAHEWSLNDDEAQPFFRQAVELGSRSGTRRACIKPGRRRSW
jgi:aryl-alcohol dehydrogenase-like predicted oxidoreductase